MDPTTNNIFRGIKGNPTPTSIDLPTLKPNEMLVKITHSGLCGTDVHFLGSGAALGHEGVGVVVRVGNAVTQVRAGDRVGGGYHRSSCGHCRYCLSGRDIWCYERDIYGEKSFDLGTLGQYYVGAETYLHKIPDGMESETAAPLQCAGATVYSALMSTVKPGHRVGVLGIGGLGHLAIQFAAKMGAEVVVFSTSAQKEAEARGFGATNFCLLTEPEKVKDPVDVLVVTSSTYPSWDKFLVKNVVARTGTIIPLAAPPNLLSLPAFPMFFEGYNVRTNLVASRGDHDDMLQFAALHNIKPQIEKFELSEAGIVEALGKLRSGKMRYRGVLVASEGAASVS